MKHLLIFILFLAFTTICFSQEPHWEKQILKHTKGLHVNQLEEAPFEWNTWIATVNVKNKIGIYRVIMTEDTGLDYSDSSYVESVYPLIKPVYSSIEPFTRVYEDQLSEIPEDISYAFIDISTVRKKKKTSIIFRIVSQDATETEYFNAELFFDEISWDYAPGTTVAVLNKNKWGVYNWYSQEMIAECDYASIDSFPETFPYEMETLVAFNKQKKIVKVDKIDYDQANGDGIFKARGVESQKWGLYQEFGDEVIEAIPMKYDSIYHFPWNGNYTAVFNDGKVGFYLSYWSYNEDSKQTVPCIYDKYKRYVTEDQIPKLAVQREGKWGWVDWLTGEEKSEFKYATPDDLPYPFYKQHLWLED